MGTGSTTKIYVNDEFLIGLRTHFDGFPDAWGADLKTFLKSGQFVNGIPGGDKRYFNGADCFALQLISEYKKGPGNLYLCSESEESAYNYRIDIKHEGFAKYRVYITCEEDQSFSEQIQ